VEVWLGVPAFFDYLGGTTISDDKRPAVLAGTVSALAGGEWVQSQDEPVDDLL